MNGGWIIGAVINGLVCFEAGKFRFQFGDVFVKRRVNFLDLFNRKTRRDVLRAVPVESFRALTL